VQAGSERAAGAAPEDATAEATRQRAALAELAISLALLALGGCVLWGAARMPASAGFSGVGPGAMPHIVGAGLALVGLWLLAQRLSGGWRDAEPHPTARGEHAFCTAGFVWVTAGLVAQMLLIATAGFVLAATALFVGVARARCAMRCWASASRWRSSCSSSTC
jgi:putative tricarboxylic transport membrane protein